MLCYQAVACKMHTVSAAMYTSITVLLGNDDNLQSLLLLGCVHCRADETDSMAYDSESSSVIRLTNGMVLYLREVNSYLALVCLLRADNFHKKGLIDYNIDCFKVRLNETIQHAAHT
jgi:Ras-related GTP-binding protein C/D